MTTVSAPAPAPQEQRMLLRGVDWPTYRRIADALTGRHVRLTYDQGNLQFTTISGTHGNFSWLMGRLIAVLTEELNLPIKGFSDMTCDREDLERGLEADQCFYLTNEPLVRNKQELDLTTDPPPDFTVEVDISRGSRSRLGIYAALGVPEVWRFDGENLVFHQLQATGQYAVAENSRYFPFLAGADLVRFLQQGTAMDENSLVRSFRQWVRERIRGGKQSGGVT